MRHKQFTMAIKVGMKSDSIEDIEIHGEKIDNVKRNFIRPNVIPWTAINKVWGVKEI